MMQRVGVPLTLEGYLGALVVDSMAQLDAETASDIPNWLIEGVDARIVPQNDITSNFSELENLRSVVKNR